MQAHPRAASGWHGGFAPGGYEWWRFCAEGEGRRVVVTFYDGWPVDRLYRRAYHRYRRQPTRRTPPLPCDCRGFEASVYRGDQVEHRLALRLPPGELIATDDPSRIAIGLSRMEIEPDGSIRLHVQEQPPFAITLAFRPPAGVAASILGDPAVIAGQANWLAAPYRYDVTGMIGQQTLSATGTWDHGWGDLRQGLELHPSVLRALGDLEI